MKKTQNPEDISTDITQDVDIFSQKGIHSYQIKVISLKDQKKFNLFKEKALYLNIFMRSGKNIQTKCLNIYDQDQFFYITSPSEIQKMEIIDYDRIYPLVKINLKGLKDSFSIQLNIQRKNLTVIIKKQIVGLQKIQVKKNNSNNLTLDNIDFDTKHRKVVIAQRQNFTFN